MTRSPPGRSTRANSASAGWRSGTWTRASAQTMTSAESSRSGSRSSSATWNSPAGSRPAGSRQQVRRCLLDAGLGYQHVSSGGAERDETVCGGDPSGPAAVAGVGQRGDHGFRDAARATGLVDNKDPSGRVSVPQQIVEGQWGQPPQIQDAGADPSLGVPAMIEVTLRLITTSSRQCHLLGQRRPADRAHRPGHARQLSARPS